MALNIENETAEGLARQVAAATGESLTEAITHALEERLERLKSHRSKPDLVETLLAISRRCSSLPDLDRRSAEEILGYEELGPGRYTPREVA
jgi:antitoxin VapB